jgi:hypothetical protein
METHRLKMRIGPHEFEAEGTEEAIDKRLEAFKELIALTSDRRNPQAKPNATNATTAPQGNGATNQNENSPLARIFDTTATPMTLTALPSSVGDGLLLLLHGHRHIKGIGQVSVSELLAGLRTSGFSIVRMDDITPRLLAENMILKIGKRNASKYRLTNIGAQRADAIADELLKKVD